MSRIGRISVLICLLTFLSKESVFAESEGWARGAFAYSWVSSIAMLSLSIASEATKANVLPSAPLGGSAMIVTAISTPIVFAGSKSTGVDLPESKRRLISWVTYGGHLAMGAVLMGTGIGGNLTPPPAIVTCSGILGALSIVNMGFDARERANAATSSSSQDSHRPALSLGAYPVRKGGGASLTLAF